MTNYMIGELKRFFTTFGIFIVLFIVAGSLLRHELYVSEKTYYEIIL